MRKLNLCAHFFCGAFFFWVMLAFVSAQPTNSENTAAQKLSPGATEVAKEIGLQPLLERYFNLPEIERGENGGVMSLAALSLRQQITETVVATSLEIDGVTAEIDNELGQIAAVRALLEARRDRALAISSIANIVAGGATGILGTALQFKDTTQKAGNIIGVTGGGISTLLSIVGLKQQSGGKQPLGITPNMLAKIFDRQPEFHSEYPTEIWTYLNAVAPGEKTAETRRAQLLKAWTDNGRIEQTQSPKATKKIELVTSGASNQRKLSLDVLADRAAMLNDVKAKISLMKRDLSKLMLALRSQ